MTAVAVRVDAERLHVGLADGREISAPLSWFPRLEQATAQERANHRLIGDGVGIHWEALDEDISIEALLHPTRDGHRQSGSF